MKQMRYLVLLLLILTTNWTASSQIIGLSREQKIEIVSTLKSYDAVLIEINLTDQLLSQSKELNVLYKQQLVVKDKLIANLEAQIKTYESENEILDIQIKKEKKKKLLMGGAGILLLISTIIIK